MRSSPAYPLLLAALIAAGGAAGYLLGRPAAPALQAASAAVPDGTGRAAGKDGGGERSSTATALAVMEKLKADDPTDRDTGKQIAAWEKIRAFTVEQCLAALDENGEQATAVTRNEAACMLYYRLGELAPVLALKRAMALATPLDTHFMRPVFIAWFRKDPDAAYAWSMQLPEGQRDHLGAADKMAATLRSLPPEEMLRRTEGKDPVLRQLAIVNIAELAANNPAEREAFLRTLDSLEGDDRYLGMKMLLRTWGGSDPAAVLENWDSFKYQDRPDGRPVRDEVIARWASRDPAGALGWMDTHPDKAELHQQLEAFRRWSDRDQNAADRWLEGRADPQAIAAEMVKQGHANSLSSPAYFSDQAKRKQADQLRGYYRVWSKTDPEGAARWISGIDAASAAALNTPADESR
jgi:hypothetical protein